MSFFRTVEGLGNQAIFYGKRYMVYVEEEPGLDPARSVDISFWSSYFENSYGGGIFEFKGLGGKKFVEEMAGTIVNNNVLNSLCAMDMDYDDIFGRMINDDRVFYSYGYGVENDIISSISISRLIMSAIPSNPDRANIGSNTWENLVSTISLEARCLVSDQLAAAKGASTLDRSKPVSVINTSVSGLPIRFRRKPIQAAIRALKGSGPQLVCVCKPAASARHVPAHLLFEIMYHTVIETIKKLTDVKYSKDVVRNMILGFFSISFYGHFDEAEKQHYETLSKRDITKFSSL